MEYALIILSVCLFILLVCVVLKYIHIKREIRLFTNRTRELEKQDYQQPLKISTFDKDIVELANVVNEHIDIQQAMAVEHLRSGKRLNNVISGISHDFRTPLTAALGYLQMIEKSGELSEENREYLDIATQKNKYLKELSDEFFELTKLEGEQEKILTESINLSNLISEHILEQYGWIESRGLETEFQVADGIFAEVNEHYFVRILDNLFSNAEKYAYSRLCIRLENLAEKIVLTVENDMESSEEIEVERVFEPFYRGVSRTKNGSGLGMYVVKCLCGKMKMDAEAEIKNGMFCLKITQKK